jgi:hypothetical protein
VITQVLTHTAALAILDAAPTQAAGLRLTRGRILTLLRRSGRGNQAGLAERLPEQLRAPAVRQLE